MPTTSPTSGSGEADEPDGSATLLRTAPPSSMPLAPAVSDGAEEASSASPSVDPSPFFSEPFALFLTSAPETGAWDGATLPPRACRASGSDDARVSP